MMAIKKFFENEKRVKILAALFVLILIISGIVWNNYFAPFPRHELSSLGVAYQYFAIINGKSPESIDDLRENIHQFPTLAEMIGTGEFIVIWNAFLYNDEFKNGGYLLGYEKQVAQHGGYIITARGHVSRITAEEFSMWKPIASRDEIIATANALDYETLAASSPLTHSETVTNIDESGVTFSLPGENTRKNAGRYNLKTLGMSLMIMGHPEVNFSSNCSKFSTNQFIQNGELIHEELFEVGAAKALLRNDRTYRHLGQWCNTVSLIIGNEDKSVTIMAVDNSFDLSDPQDLLAAKIVMDALKQIQWDPQKTANDLDQLDFRITPDRSLKLRDMSPSLQAITYNQSGQFPNKLNAGEPTFLIIKLTLPLLTRGREDLAYSLIKEKFEAEAAAAHLVDLKYYDEDKVQVNGLVGMEFICSAFDDRYQIRKFLYVTGLYDGTNNVYFLWSTVLLENRDQFQPIFSQMVKSFELKRDSSN